MVSQNKPNHISLFAGCDGLSLGLFNAGWRGVFAIEKNQDAFSTLKANLIEKVDHFDWPDWLPQKNHSINTILKTYSKQLKELKGKIDLVAGGPPCQGFSMAGRRDENDKRNQLIKSYVRFIRLVEPKVIFFENVKGFTLEFKKNKNKGVKYSNYVESALIKAGYFVKGQLVNFAEYGLPQKRTRFILIGLRRDVSQSSQALVDQFFIQLKNNCSSFLASKNLDTNTNLQDAISDLLMENGTQDSPDTKSFRAGLYSTCKSNYQSLMRVGSKTAIPDSHRFANHSKTVTQRFKYILKYSRKNKDIDSSIRDKYKIKKHTIIPLAKEEKSPTITSLPDDYIHYSEPRILTVREYARIQSFPDWFEFKGKYTTGGKLRKNDVPRYTQIGNAIPPLFSEQAGYVLFNILNNVRQK